MAEAIGFAASIIAVVGLAGQVIQGCQNVKAWVGEFNSAPKGIQDLIQELNSMEEFARITDILRIKIVDRKVNLQRDQALQQCLDAVARAEKAYHRCGCCVSGKRTQQKVARLAAP